jgi:tryptophan synthase alpha subunit
MSQFSDHADIIDFYGLDEMADALRTTRPHVRQMRNRNSIPSHHWDKLVADAQRRGVDGVITLNVLAETQKKMFRGGRRECAAA